MVMSISRCLELKNLFSNLCNHSLQKVSITLHNSSHMLSAYLSLLGLLRATDFYEKFGKGDAQLFSNNFKHIQASQLM